MNFTRVLQFDGVNDYVNVPYDSSLADSGSYTLMAWVYMSQAPSSKQAIIEAETTGWSRGIFIESHNEISILTGEVGVWGGTGTALPIGQWNLVAFTVEESGTYKVYLNGAQIASGTVSSSVPTRAASGG